MQRSFSNFFRIALIDQVTSIDGNTITCKSGYTPDFILTENNMDLKEVQKEDGANDYFNQTSKAATHPIREALRKKYRNTRVVIQMETTQGDLFTWGSIDLPVRVKINSTLKGDNWEMTRQSPEPIIR